MCLCRVDAEGRSRERGEERLRTSYEMKMDGEGWRRGWIGFDLINEGNGNDRSKKKNQIRRARLFGRCFIE